MFWPRVVCVESGMDWRRGAVGLCTESEGFHKLSVVVEDNFQDNVSENDLLLISKEKVSVVQVKFVV